MNVELSLVINQYTIIWGLSPISTSLWWREFNNSTNISKTNKHLSNQTIENKRGRDIWRWSGDPGPGLGHTQNVICMCWICNVEWRTNYKFTRRNLLDPMCELEFTEPNFTIWSLFCTDSIHIKLGFFCTDFMYFISPAEQIIC